MKKYVLTVVATCSGYLYRVLGQGGVNCWGALSKCRECEYCLFVLKTHVLIAMCCRYRDPQLGGCWGV